MKPRRLLYPTVAALGIMTLGAYAYIEQRKPQAPAEQSGASPASADNAAKGGRSAGSGGPAAVDVTTVSAMRLVDDVNATGTLRSNEAVMVRPEVAGRIVRLNFSDGQQVKKGQV